MRWWILLGALALAGCDDQSSDEDHEVFNKGCYGKGPNCGYDPNAYNDDSTSGSSDVPPPPPDCPGVRKDAAKTGLTSTDLHTLLPGRWQNCTTSSESRMTTDADGRLLFGGELFTIGLCGETSCQVGWGAQGSGTMQVWSQPDAIRIELGTTVASYVRIPEP